ncbi:hypothetical protein SYNTR_1038 [Candidatus Syntrophocurvum alkaliphilum]|uniref:Uracil-DNA glycosylase-like domain-containing protein n=1 Tax=Candidatus Syntrophocurvum alkaliphilum TaxID=2293317 RepID=A0A6I6DJS0_9FIRM|nr:uracil-DNA glycosylase family protein [Candidatus Syntrophocurvum alkaliphilum]QGT99631.1 hypothetical protein SYNTR_1038 [Candidatus Syntrophocurvum alkaliphilum]
MTNSSREKKIKLIIDMEERINNCMRCKKLLKCRRKSSLGKGDLEPEMMLIFEAENNFNQDLDNVIKLRNHIKKGLSIHKIYHSFMVRCQPKACTRASDSNLYGQSYLLDNDNNCKLTARRCDGIAVHPTDEEIISCLPFIIEEIEILQPQYIILFGNRVTDFILKSYGIYDNIEIGKKYNYGKSILYSASDEEIFFNELLKNDAETLASISSE